MPYNIENENNMYNDYLNQVFNKINTTFILILLLFLKNI